MRARSTELQEVLELFSSYLRNNGRKMTRQRQMVVESFLLTGGHVSTEDLYQLVRKKDKKLGFVTVFRTLKALADCGIARKIDLNDGRIRFEHSYRRPHHHHIVCVECNRTIEFVSPEGERIQDEITSQYGFKPVRHTLQIFGVCPECQKDQRPSQGSVDSDLIFARDALKIAMDTEKRGINFYRTASETVTQPSTIKVFLKMLDEEKDHLSKLKKEWKRLIKKDRNLLDAPVFLHFDYEALDHIFPSRGEAKKKLKANIGGIDALELAMKMEMEACKFFTRFAKRFNDTKGRDIFLKFADEENDHYNVIKEEYDRVTAAH
ncbi:transcriptional repressor [Acidobacteria bacterium AH-259-D05]|nr:transcriptional repressor [Acidobacteria bacterium AH-259-D05]